MDGPNRQSSTTLTHTVLGLCQAHALIGPVATGFLFAHGAVPAGIVQGAATVFGMWGWWHLSRFRLRALPVRT